MMPSLLAHLASEFGLSTEKVATATLAYVLGNSHTARGAFIRHLTNKFDIAVPDDLQFKHQVRLPNGATPDLVGFSSDKPRVIVEAKFWAGLTDNQPDAYLRNLPDNTTGLLVFIAPAARVDYLWSEILRRCCGNLDHAPGERVRRVNDYHSLGLVEWLEVISAIYEDLPGAQEREEKTIADVMQLRGLCEHLESETFQPISENELSPMIGLRITQYRDIINTVVEQLCHAGHANTDGLRATTAGFSWGRSFRLNHGNICDLVFRPDAWARFETARTPLWLVVRPHQDQNTQELETVLQQLRHQTPQPLIARDENGQLLVSIFVLTGVDRNQVINRVIEQIHEVAALL